MLPGYPLFFRGGIEKAGVRLSSEIGKSALLTMEMLAKSFGARTVMLDFTASKPEQRNVTEISSQQAA
jgi:hypothetical protein